MAAQPIDVLSVQPTKSRSALSATSVTATSLLFGDLAAFALTVTVVSLCLDSGIDVAWHRAFDRMWRMDLSWHGWGTLLVMSGLFVHLSGRGHYTQRPPFWMAFGDILRAAGFAALCDFFVTVALYHEPYTIEGGLRWMLVVPAIVTIRQLVRSMLDHAGLWERRTLVVGSADLVDGVRTALESEPSLGYRVTGATTLESVARSELSLPDVLQRWQADFIVLAVGGIGSAAENNMLTAMCRSGVPFALAPCQGGLPVPGLRPQYFLTHDVILLITRNRLLLPFNRAAKHAIDFVIALMLVIVLSPLLLAIALLVARDGGPVLFTHERVGRAGRRFGCLKFRTMVTNAADVLYDYLSASPEAREEWIATHKLQDDPRVTPVGGFLRRTSLDELPQLFNVLRGDMSLVGPRPIVAAEVPRYGHDICYYYETRPGMTGLWQVTGRSDASYERRVHLDAWYVRNWTPGHDIAILLKTIPAVLLKKGAV